MLSGFNTNVRHRGLLLHVQTEDSGRAHPHIITHLYQGGTILASERCQYGERLGSESLVAEVRALMEDQHRAMLRRLIHGELDSKLTERLGAQALSDDASGVTASGATGPTAPGAAQTSAAKEESGSAPSVLLEAEVETTAGERPLDELVLEYLVERARKAPRSAS